MKGHKMPRAVSATKSKPTTKTTPAAKTTPATETIIDINTAMETAADEFAELDLSALQPVLPREGWHTAKISQVTVSSKSDVVWLAVTCRLDDGYALPAMVGPLAAKPDSPHLARVPEGLRLMFSTAKALGVQLPEKLKPDMLEELFEGKRIDVKLSKKIRDGVGEMLIRKSAPPGTGGK
jgi:hypothetical protein